MPATTTPASGSVPVALPPIWHYARQIVTGTADVPVLDKNGAPLTAGTMIVSGVSASSHQGLEWDDASTLRLSTSAAAGRAVFMYKYQELA
ncbi:MAG: hypothetical protein ACH34X_11320 [Thiolinea sp.]